MAKNKTANDVQAQSVKNGVLRPSGKRAQARQAAAHLKNVDISEAALSDLIERGASAKSAAEWQTWTMDVCAFLLAVHAKSAIAESR